MNLNKPSLIVLSVVAGILLGISSYKPKTTDRATENVQLNTNVESVNNTPPVSSDIKEGKQPASPLTIKLTERVIRIEGPIAENAMYIAEDIKRLGVESNRPIHLLINSPGGSVFHGLMIISAIKSSKAPVITVCTLLCASMAAVIHQFGTERQMVEGSTLMFHDASGGQEGPIPNIITRLNYISRSLDKIDAQIAARAGITLAELHTMEHVEVWLDAEDSTIHHFNDKIVSVLVTQPTPAGTVSINPFADPGQGKTGIVTPKPNYVEWK